MKKAILALLVAIGLVGLAVPAHAILYKNPGHGLKTGYRLAGFSWESGTRPLKSGDAEFDMEYSLIDSCFGFGVTKSSLVEIQFGLFSAGLGGGESEGGLMYGAAYRHDLSGGSFQHGFTVGYHRVSLGMDTDINLLEGAYGVTVPLSKTVSFFGGGVVSMLDGTTAFGGTFENAMPLGGYAGIEHQGSRDTRWGLEVHALHETTFGVYGHWRY